MAWEFGGMVVNENPVTVVVVVVVDSVCKAVCSGSAVQSLLAVKTFDYLYVSRWWWWWSGMECGM